MSISAKKIKKLPDTPGVYFFLGRRHKSQGPSLPTATYPQMPVGKSGQGRALRFREVLYIGKAGSLRDRVRSYFSRAIAETRGTGIEQMVLVAEDITYEKTDSVLEAVLLEAELIKKYQPKYNVREKDDKRFNYVIITKEDFPRVLLIRGKELVALRNKTKLKTKDYKLKTIFGPFPHGGTLREALRIIRKIFPYRDKCAPPRHSHILENVGMSSLARSPYSSILQNTRISNRKKNILANHSNVLENIRIRRGCFNRQIGLCPGVCTGEISKKEYAKTIRNISMFFKGKKK